MDRRLDWLEVMRGGAALWVLLHHTKLSVDHFVSDMGSQPWFDNGYLGVDFFFVLSGFIIAFASQRLADRGGHLRSYASARLVRIYVPYLPVGLAMYLLYLVLPGLSEGGRDPSLLTSLTLLPANKPPALSVAWTLVHEMIFYALYALWFVGKKIFRIAFAAWVLMIVVLFWSGVHLTPVAQYFLSPINLCFVLGVLVFQLNRRAELPLGLATLIGLSGLATVVWQALGDTPDRVTIAIGFTLAVWGAASSATLQLKPWRPLVILGAASYAVYLVHNPALSLLTRLLPSGLDAGSAFALVAMGSLGSGILYWLVYERPMLSWVRKQISERRVQSIPANP